MSQPSSRLPFRFRLPSRRTRLGRVGCTIVLVIWFAILLLPCFCLALASQGEISVRLGDLPGQSLRVWLLSESHQRGLGISRPSMIASSVTGQQCLQTNVSFMLWEGKEDATIYCECFAQSSSSTWDVVSNNQGSCTP
ncbi:MAG: hypothetical protein ABI690_14035 [Chloroflexota bacterium]